MKLEGGVVKLEGGCGHCGEIRGGCGEIRGGCGEIRGGCGEIRGGGVVKLEGGVVKLWGCVVKLEGGVVKLEGVLCNVYPSLHSSAGLLAASRRRQWLSTTPTTSLTTPARGAGGTRWGSGATRMPLLGGAGWGRVGPGGVEGGGTCCFERLWDLSRTACGGSEKSLVATEVLGRWKKKRKKEYPGARP